MQWNTHSNLKGAYSFLSASQYHWINYDEEKLIARWSTAMAAARGTQYHELAQQAIKLGHRFPANHMTVNMYVNDAIGFRMTPEQVLYYSENAFGTADAISFRNNELRIHDLKTGTTKPSMSQLYVYLSYFCLEYGIKPHTIKPELRLYWNDEIHICTTEPDKRALQKDHIFVSEFELDEAVRIMDKIITSDKLIRKMKEELL